MKKVFIAILLGLTFNIGISSASVPIDFSDPQQVDPMILEQVSQIKGNFLGYYKLAGTSDYNPGQLFNEISDNFIQIDYLMSNYSDSQRTKYSELDRARTLMDLALMLNNIEGQMDSPHNFKYLTAYQNLIDTSFIKLVNLERKSRVWLY